MPPFTNKDAPLKKTVQEIIINCELDDLILDKEIQLNITGETDGKGNLSAEKEIDVIARFSYGGKRILLLFECENSSGSENIRKEYKSYNADIRSIQQSLRPVRVVNSADGRFQSRHLKDIDLIRVCFVYGGKFPEAKLRTCLAQAKHYSFLVWSHLALSYYRATSAILRGWSKYELFKDFHVAGC
jgi:hypothetical protein